MRSFPPVSHLTSPPRAPLPSSGVTNVTRCYTNQTLPSALLPRSPRVATLATPCNTFSTAISTRQPATDHRQLTTHHPKNKATAQTQKPLQQCRNALFQANVTTYFNQTKPPTNLSMPGMSARPTGNGLNLYPQRP